MNVIVLPHESADGPAQMALDEALLEAVAADPARAVCRTYEWSVPTLSLGYFQTIAEAESDPRWRGVPIVRRPTGGGALMHDRELTYAVIVPRTHPGARASRALYESVHAALARLLVASGIDAQRRGAVSDPAGAARPFLCFRDRDPEDIVAGGYKLIGSAQRRAAGAVLQHGSILLARAPLTPELPGAGDLADVSTTPADWSTAVAVRLVEALGVDAEAGAMSATIRRRAGELADAVYSADAWTRRR